MKVKFIFAWYDFWIGLFWDSKNKKLYIFPVPMLGIVIFKKPKIGGYIPLEEVLFFNESDGAKNE